MIHDWRASLLGEDAVLREALELINTTGVQFAVVVDHQGVLIGTLSDGDIRRALLRGLELTVPVSAALHRDPLVAREDESVASSVERMRQKGVRHLPVVNDRGVVVGLRLLDELLAPAERPNTVVIMAGGLGSRLGELTESVPKPMLVVGGRPLLETIIRRFMACGFRDFLLAVNYRADQIEAHFGDGESLGSRIRYIREERKLGTAGALSMLPSDTQFPILVSNGDLLTLEDFGAMIDAHGASRADATMAVRGYDVQIPYGVVQEYDGRITDIVEKPVHQHLILAGMYVLTPQVLRPLLPNQYFDMPDLLRVASAGGMHTRCHRINSYWLDIGRLHDYERANREFDEVFADVMADSTDGTTPPPPRSPSARTSP